MTVATSSRTKAYLFEQQVVHDHLEALLVQQMNSQVVSTLYFKILIYVVILFILNMFSDSH